jgi:hypothetical protein
MHALPDEVIDVLTRFMSHLGEHGDCTKAIEVGNRILRLEPLHDSVVRRLMQLYSESGRRGAAVELYRQHDHALRTELNAKPEAATREVLVGLAQSNGERTSVGRTTAPEQNAASAPLIGEVLHEPISDTPRANPTHAEFGAYGALRVASPWSRCSSVIQRSTQPYTNTQRALKRAKPFRLRRHPKPFPLRCCPL